MFVSFANFHWRFIRDFNRIAISLTSILKKTRLFTNKVIKNSSNADKTVVELFISKKENRVPNIRAIKKPNFLISDAKRIFNYLRQTFIKSFDTSSFWSRILYPD